MTMTIALRANTYGYGRGGGHLWAYLNWARGLQRAGCTVLWLEVVATDDAATARGLSALRTVLEPCGLGDSLVASTPDARPVSKAEVLDPGELDGGDLLLDLAYDTPELLLRRCRRSALVDIDPGQTQCWWADGLLPIAPHDVYFTTGERIGGPGSTVPDCGVTWCHTTPPVDTRSWTSAPPPNPTAPFTTVTHWDDDEWFSHGGVWFDNNKRTGFQPFLALPELTQAPLELALPLTGLYDAAALAARGWGLRDSWEVARTPQAYRAYIRASRGEFSCAKPSTVHLGNAWVSDRTLCYLASGRPAVVRYTGPSSVLPDGEGLFRFQTLEAAVTALDDVMGDYERHSRAARELAVETFDARKVVINVLERALS